MQELAQFAEESGITTCIENTRVRDTSTKFNYGIYAETLTEYVQKANHKNVGIAHKGVVTY